MLVYLNEKGEKTPAHIVGLRDNYDVADCCGIDEKTDQANGRLIAAAPELLEACEAAVVALVDNPFGRVLSEDNLKAVQLCRVRPLQSARSLTTRFDPSGFSTPTLSVHEAYPKPAKLSLFRKSSRGDKIDSYE